MNSDNYHIPLEIAHKFLATFGITKPSKAYERWLNSDGFELNDFGEVLFESKFIFTIDWRACLDEELATISQSLADLGVTLRLELDDDGESGIVRCQQGQANVAYRPNDDSDFEDVIARIQSIMPQHIEFRECPDNGGSDTLIYAVLPDDEWADLERADPTVLEYFFVPLPASIE